jgi:hypothetical protein
MAEMLSHPRDSRYFSIGIDVSTHPAFPIQQWHYQPRQGGRGHLSLSLDNRFLALPVKFPKFLLADAARVVRLLVLSQAVPNYPPHKLFKRTAGAVPALNRVIGAWAACNRRGLVQLAGTHRMIVLSCIVGLR